MFSLLVFNQLKIVYTKGIRGNIEFKSPESSDFYGRFPFKYLFKISEQTDSTY